MGETSRKVWKKPKMVVLLRGRLEEGILATCKYSGLNQPGYNNCQNIYGQRCVDISSS